MARNRRELLAYFELKDAPTILETKAISKFCVERFLSGEVDKVTVLYTHFVNTINQKPVAQTLLPISQFAFTVAPDGSNADPMLEYIFEPSPQDVLNFMLP